MEKKERVEANKSVETAELLREMRMLREEVRLAIEAAANVSHRLMTAGEVCEAMGISRHTLRRYEKLFEIPERRIGRKRVYFEAEIKSCVIRKMRFWRE